MFWQFKKQWKSLSKQFSKDIDSRPNGLHGARKLKGSFYLFYSLFLLLHAAETETCFTACFFVGSLTVISAKAVSSMINITLSGYSQLGHPLFYVMLIVMITTAIAQVK